MPERVLTALLHFINVAEVRTLFHAGLVTTPADAEIFAALGDSPQQMLAPPAVLAGAGGVQGLPPELAGREYAIRNSDQFKNAYQQFAPAFVSVPIADLVAPQAWADIAYVDELVDSLPAPGDEGALFDYCFAYGRLEAPMLLGINGAVIVSGRRALGALSPLRIQSATAEKVTFEFDALPRPNWLLLNLIPATGELLVLNGVHHLLALMRGGRDRAYCLLRQTPVEQVFNFAQEPGIFKPERLSAPRPPLLRDYLDNTIGDQVSLRAADQFMRFGVSNPPEIGVVPQSEV